MADHRVQQVIDLMHADLSRNLSLTGMAHAVNLSPSRLSHLFKEEIGMAPAQYLKSLRMQHAKELIENTFLNIRQIMARLGISDESHFVRDFKKRYGLPPAHYRIRHLNTGKAVARSAKL